MRESNRGNLLRLIVLCNCGIFKLGKGKPCVNRGRKAVHPKRQAGQAGCQELDIFI